MKQCLQCNTEISDKAKYCSDKCRMAYTRRTKDQPEHEQLTRTDVPEQTVPCGEVNTIPISKGGVWKEMHPWKPGMCKYCGTMTMKTTGEIDEMVECCHKCASLKNAR